MGEQTKVSDEQSTSDEPTRESIPDLLAHALVLPDPGVVEEPTPTSVVDEWAFSDDEPSLHDDEEMHERISSMPGLDEDADQPSMTTLRPSAVTLRPKQIQRSHREPWILAAAAVVVLATGAWLTVKGAPGDAPSVVTAAAEPETLAAPANPAPEVRQGIHMRTSVAEVTATIAGESWGPLPVSLSHLAPGTHRIRFEAPGHHPLEREVVVAEGRMVDLDVALEPKPVQVVLEVEPPTAYILVSDTDKLADGRRYTGPWPRIIELEPGPHHFVAFRAGYGSLQRKVDVAPGPKASAVRFELSKEDLYE